MVVENCKKIEPVVVKLRSKTKYTTFFLNTVYTQTDKTTERATQPARQSVRPPADKSWHPPMCRVAMCHRAAFQTLSQTHAYTHHAHKLT